MTSEIDVYQLRLPSSMSVPIPPRKRPPRHGPGEKFLKGPIPWKWLERACRLPGKALQVALLLWYAAGCTRNRTVRLCLNGTLPEGLNRQSARRGLRRLVEARLVEVRHFPGKGLEVTLLDVQVDENR